jgi:hypothetical protein
VPENHTVSARRIAFHAFLAFALIALPRSARSAIIFEAFPDPILDYDPSVRSASMAGASGAVYWGDAPNYWANPALLGYAQGIRYEDGLESLPTASVGDGFQTMLIESRATARREVLGYGGLGFAFAGRPFDGPGGIRFESKVTTTAPWSPTTTDEFFDEMWSWSVGISASGLARSYAALTHQNAPRFTQYLDLALGYAHKATGSTGKGVSSDWGLLTRCGVPIRLGSTTLAVEGAYGYSVLSSPGVAPYRYRHHRNAVSVRAALTATPGPMARTPDWIRSGFQPLISVGATLDNEHVVGPYSATQEMSGAELSLLNVVFLRAGQDRHDRTSTGWGLSLPIGSFAGVRYDHSHLDDFFGSTRRSWSVWVDPLALRRGSQP